MRKFWSIAVCLALVVSTFFSVSQDAQAASSFQIVEDADIAAKVKAFADIKALFTDKTDLNAVQTFYINQFQADVKRIDANIKPNDPMIDENISFVLENAVNGKLSVGQAKQAVDKGLQWYFYFYIRDLISNKVRPALANKDFDAATVEFHKVVQIYEGVTQGTVAKRDATYGLDMVGILKGTIEQLLKDLKEKDADDFNVHRQVLDKTIIKTYSLAAFTYATNIPTKPAADQPTAVTEGYFLYLPVYTYLRGGSAEDADYILNAFASGDPGRIDKDKIQAAMQRAMIGKVSEYVANALTKLAAGDLQGARGYAMEGNMFLSTQEVFFAKEDYASAVVYAQQFADAVDRSDLAAARKASFQMLKYMVAKDGIQLTLNEKTYKVDGESRTAASAPYINKKTYRTLVPVRLIADAINAEVSYNNSTKTVTIVKDGKKTELKVGSDTIVQDGKVNETMRLDQPVVLENGSSFIPLRAVAELFGKGVFYDNKQIIILR
ncbi:copper amine oxidase N-terminal domain-containing protein [Paenibacillus sp. LHD-117]|uniref:copper amine oxidase N-terminal domain-containing protein n=1 Tax=Paenibacillus sp. LHD-117 TaxID=3071412 RepID=UPI0027DF2443|nr:copper amine oxidase N-terminal domain-containing protein [Paenibacillus sp. LHD-117]MDQ6423244.1 copper amine oxidase N-terminal domain-containing protein [Paenibacillus sp. LHD-117]